MSIAAEIRKCVKRLKPGQVFGYGDIPMYQENSAAVVKAMSRLLKKGEIRRLSKGRFYKPRQGIAGELKPSDSELLKTILYKEGKLRGYITGTALYNKLGLTTQVPRIITVATEGSRQEKDFGTLRAKLVKSRAPIKADDVELLQYLDVLRDINDIPDADTNETLKRMAKRFSTLDDRKIRRVTVLAKNYYPAKAKALTGYLLDYTGKDNSRSLKKSLNPVTQFKVGLDRKKWPKSAAWNIK